MYTRSNSIIYFTSSYKCQHRRTRTSQWTSSGPAGAAAAAARAPRSSARCSRRRPAWRRTRRPRPASRCPTTPRRTATSRPPARRRPTTPSRYTHTHVLFINVSNLLTTLYVYLPLFSVPFAIIGSIYLLKSIVIF